jgi:hypothetical protein
VAEAPIKKADLLDVSRPLVGRLRRAAELEWACPVGTSVALMNEAAERLEMVQGTPLAPEEIAVRPW